MCLVKVYSYAFSQGEYSLKLSVFKVAFLKIGINYTEAKGEAIEKM